MSETSLMNVIIHLILHYVQISVRIEALHSPTVHDTECTELHLQTHPALPT